MLKAVVIDRDKQMPAVVCDSVTYRLGETFLEIERGPDHDVLRVKLRDVLDEALLSFDVHKPSGKNFKNKLFRFPPSILDGINNCISRGMGAVSVGKWLARNYKGPLMIPNRKTIQSYIDYKNQKLKTKERS